MPRTPKLFKQKTIYEQWKALPKRIFLDSNIVKYLLDFGEYIYEGCNEDKTGFRDTSQKLITKTSRLFSEIEAMADIFRYIHRANFEFAISETVYQELSKKENPHLSLWITDLNHHWQSVLESYQTPFSTEARIKYELAIKDVRFITNISKNDRAIILDAVRLDCNALLTVDRFADETNQKYILTKFGIMVLWPSDFIEMLKPFQALYNG